MINKLYFNGSKPPKYFINGKKVKRMMFNDQIVYDCSAEIRFAEDNVTIDTAVIDETYYKLKYTVTPEDTDEKVTYELSNPNIIKVDHNESIKEFWITTLSVGSCTITARCGDSEDSCIIKVLDNSNQEGESIPCTGITCDNPVTVDNENITPENGGGQLINVTVTPANTTDTITCTVHNNTIVYVECINGKWYVFSNGIYQEGKTTVITFKCGNHSADCYVTVT